MKLKYKDDAKYKQTERMKNVKLKYKDDEKYEANRTDEECEVEV